MQNAETLPDGGASHAEGALIFWGISLFSPNYSLWGRLRFARKRIFSPDRGRDMCFRDFPPSPEGAKAGPLPSGSTDGKTLALLAVSCECVRSLFPALHLVCPHKKE